MDNGILTVSQINTYLALKLKDDFRLKSKLVSGEVSNFKRHDKTGHIFFTLKDDKSSIKAIMYKSDAEKLKVTIEDGMSVIVLASVAFYERDGACQLYVSDIRPCGTGLINASLERLKEKLRQEGLCDESRKRPIPEYPDKIGIITAKNSAAEKDILSILERRYPMGHIILFPVLVQGENAPDSISSGIISACRSDCDVLILARGGGSSEDLSCFNTEKVARAVAESSIPIITAVGHETDTTLVDYVSDLRAPTPSAAAELVAPDKKILLEILQNSTNMLYNYTLDNILKSERKLSSVSHQFNLLNIERKISSTEEDIKHCEYKLNKLVSGRIDKIESSLLAKEAEFEQLNPLSILSRGYSAVSKNGRIIASTDDLSIGEIIEIKLGKGRLSAKITEIEE